MKFAIIFYPDILNYFCGIFVNFVTSLNIVKSYLLPSFPHSAGVGRTGCFIVIDSMLERLKHETTVDIYGHVTCLRAQRNYMVQTEDQYVFAHDAVLEAVIAGVTELPARSLYTHIQQLMQIVPGENCTGMELEFKVTHFSIFMGDTKDWLVLYISIQSLFARFCFVEKKILC